MTSQSGYGSVEPAELSSNIWSSTLVEEEGVQRRLVSIPNTVQVFISIPLRISLALIYLFPVQ